MTIRDMITLLQHYGGKLGYGAPILLQVDGDEGPILEEPDLRAALVRTTGRKAPALVKKKLSPKHMATRGVILS